MQTRSTNGYENKWASVWGETGYAVSQSIYPQDINYKGKNNKFTVEKPGRNLNLNERITSNRTCECHEPYDMIHWEGHNIVFVVFLPKNFSWIMRKTDKSKMMGTWQNDQYSSKVSGS